MTTIYVTKYALSSGPFKAEAELKSEGRMAVWSAGGYRNYAHGKDFWLTEEEALTDCERRRETKLKSIEKQKAKIEKIQFTISD